AELSVHEKVHEVLHYKIVAQTRTLTVGDVRDPNNALGAVINAGAQKKILEYVALGRHEGRIVVGGEAGPGDGFFVMPTIVDGIAPGGRLAPDALFRPALQVVG